MAGPTPPAPFDPSKKFVAVGPYRYPFKSRQWKCASSPIRELNPNFGRLLAEGTLGLGESYMDGWWDVEALDEFIARLRRARLKDQADGFRDAWLAFKSRVWTCSPSDCHVE